MGQKLGHFVPLLGGPDHAQYLVPVIELLCGVEEAVVRNACVQSTNKILRQLSTSNTKAVQSFLELIKKLVGEGEAEMFYDRNSASQIIPYLYRVLNSDFDKAAIREIYGRLIEDDSPIVRKSAALSFSELVTHADENSRAGDFLNFLKIIVSDQKQFVKVIGIDVLGHYSKLLKQNNSVTVLNDHIMPIIKESRDNKSWCIKLSLSKVLSSLISVFTDQESSIELFNTCILLLQDPEPDVRIASIHSISSFVNLVGGENFCKEFVPIATILVEDPMINVRKAMADNIVEIARLVGSSLVTQYISDLIFKIVGDDDPSVRLKVLVKFNVIAEEIPTLCSKLTTTMKSMFTDTHWRIRKQMALTSASLIQHMGKDYYKDNFLASFLLLFKDEVGEVRGASCGCVAPIAIAADVTWVYENIFPAIKAMATDEYLVRLSMLTALQGLMTLELSDKFQSEVLALVIGTSHDKVANIRLKAAQVLGAVCKTLNPDSSRLNIRPVLSDLINDKDKDVQYFADLSLRECP